MNFNNHIEIQKAALGLPQELASVHVGGESAELSGTSRQALESEEISLLDPPCVDHQFYRLVVPEYRRSQRRQLSGLTFVLST